MLIIHLHATICKNALLIVSMLEEEHSWMAAELFQQRSDAFCLQNIKCPNSFSVVSTKILERIIL